MIKIKQVAMLLVVMLVVIPLLVGACAPEAAPTESPADFYKGKTIRWIIGSTPGGGHDTVVRVTAPYFKEYLGARAIRLENISEAGGVVALNMAWDATPDGLTMASHTQKTTVLSDLDPESGAQYKAKELSVIGAMTSEVGHWIVVNPEGPYKSIADLQQAKGLKSAGPYSAATTAACFADILGLDAKITPGVTTGDARLALLRGEIDFAVEAPGATADRIKSGEVLALCSNLSKPHIAVPDVPPVADLVDLSPEQEKRLELIGSGDGGKWLYTGPNVPKERVEYLRQVFEMVQNDPAFMKDRAEKVQRWPVPEPWLTGAEAQKSVEDFYDAAQLEYDSMVKYLSEKYFTVK